MATPGRAPDDLGLCTDLYELRMAASYLRREMTGPATFSLFVRRLPPDRGFLVAAGLESCLRLLEDYSLSAEDLDYLHSALGFTTGDLAALATITFTGDVRAVPEGRVVFADEPILEVTAPLPEAQLVETLLLNQVTFATSIASKAARCRLAAPAATLVDFAARRTHGLEAALTVARSSVLAGFDATSYVEAARALGVPAVGTMAHSYVQAFPSEIEAFAAFAEDFPDLSVFLVDTYDTTEGIRLSIEVADKLGMPPDFGLRLDSGDLGSQAVTARSMLDAAGYAEARIMASGGLDELSIAELVQHGAPIDAYGVGTRMGVSWDAPSLDSAYKLVAIGDRPVMKLSAGKITAPGAKQVFRAWDEAHHDAHDIVALAGEAAPPGFEPLLVPVMVGGRRTTPAEDLPALRERVRHDLARLPAATTALRAPSSIPVRWSADLDALTRRVSGELSVGTSRG
jgi:nicotinate phosphoribosyltransferase